MLLRKSEGKRLQKNPKRQRKKNTEKELKVTGCENVRCTHLAQEAIQLRVSLNVATKRQFP